MENNSMLHADLRLLKNMLKNSGDFTAVKDQFFDRVSQNPECRGNDAPEALPFFLKVVTSAFQRVFNARVKIAQLVIKHVSKYKFYHGVCYANGMPLALFYFEDIELGMIITLTPREDDRASMIRFTAIEANADGPPVYVHDPISDM